MSNRRKLKKSVIASDDNRPGAQMVVGKGYPGAGRYNVYVCTECDAKLTVVNRDEGVTPMLLACRAEGCTGRTVSMGYPRAPIPESLLPATFEWYRPNWDDPLLKHDALRAHVLQGGLALRSLV